MNIYHTLVDYLANLCKTMGNNLAIRTAGNGFRREAVMANLQRERTKKEPQIPTPAKLQMKILLTPAIIQILRLMPAMN